MSVEARVSIASIRQRLLNLAKQRGEEFQFVLDRFAVERLLYRLSQSEYRGDFLLKGAMLFSAWFDQPHRSTRDADFLGFGTPDAGRLSDIVAALCVHRIDDGMDFDARSINVEAIREEARYDGLRVRLRAMLGHARCNVQWDVGFGDAVTPGPDEITFPTLLPDLPAPRIRVYPRETVFAEKLEAVAQLGMANSRMKDYFDLLALVREGAMSPDLLRDAITNTFARRGTMLPASVPFGLSAAFARDQGKQTQWRAFLGRNRLSGPSLDDAVTEIRGFVLAIGPN